VNRIPRWNAAIRKEVGPLRTTDQELQRRHREGDTRARDELIERYLPLARQLAFRYRDRSEPVADLNQVAYLGLMAAVDRWDHERGTAFSTFAVPTILGQLRRHFRDSTWLVRPPRDLQELWLDVSRARDELWQELGRSPTARDVADRLDVTIEQVSDALQLGSTRVADSLDELLRPDDPDGVTVLDHAADPDDGYEVADAVIALEQMSGVLDDRAREVVRLRYREDLLQREIAERVGCSQMHVSRILREAVSALTDHANSR
jgi:RNA polymerase sigma-B factor